MLKYRIWLDAEFGTLGKKAKDSHSAVTTHTHSHTHNFAPLNTPGYASNQAHFTVVFHYTLPGTTNGPYTPI